MFDVEAAIYKVALDGVFYCDLNGCNVVVSGKRSILERRYTVFDCPKWEDICFSVLVVFCEWLRAVIGEVSYNSWALGFMRKCSPLFGRNLELYYLGGARR